MIKVRTFGHQSEAHLAKALLQSHGIEAKSIGTKVLVDEENLAKAKRLIEQVMAKDMVLSDGESDHFSKAVKYGLGAAVILPVVFNAISLFHAYKYWESSEKDSDAKIRVAFILALQLITVVVVRFLLNMTADVTSMFTSPDDLNF